MSQDCSPPLSGLELLAAIAQPPEAIDAVDVAIVVAHPDDETIGCGAALARMRHVRVILVTDGAPRSMHDAREHGLASADAYAALRFGEWRRALDIAGVDPGRRLTLCVPDQQAAYRLVEITDRLAGLFAGNGTRIVLTHAYEGGHPDHDATAFAVHHAARQLARSGGAIDIVEMPFYREADGCFSPQSFVPVAGSREIVHELTTDERRRKSAMRDAHASQMKTLQPFALDRERFRLAPRYDFREPANGGRLLYERFDWGLDGRAWCALAAAAEDRLC